MNAESLRGLVEAIEALQEYRPHAQKHPHASRGFVTGMRKKRPTESGEEYGHLHKGEVLALIETFSKEQKKAALAQAGEGVDTQLCDNPSGTWCRSCRATGMMMHCSDPINCGGMVPMAHHDDCEHTKPNTGNAEADKHIGRLMSADPQFDDCTDAAAYIHRLAMLAAAPAAQGADDDDLPPPIPSDTDIAYADGYAAGVRHSETMAAAPAVEVDEAMVERALNAQPFAASHNEATRVYELMAIRDGTTEAVVIRAALAAALKQGVSNGN